VVERALEEVRGTRRARFKEVVEEALKSMEISAEKWIKTVRESRAER